MTLRSRRRMRAGQQEPQQRAGGEQLDVAAEQSIRLAHRALERFPDLVRRHKYVAGGAAVAGALLVLASVAVARRMGRGETADEAIAGLTESEIETLHSRERDDESDEPDTQEPVAPPPASGAAPGPASDSTVPRPEASTLVAGANGTAAPEGRDAPSA